MKKLFLFFQKNQTGISALLLFVLSAIAVVLMYPREAKFKYEFQKGKPWLYPNLVAPFDFAVLKSESAIEEEKAEIRRNKSVFLNYNEEVLEQSLNEYEEAIKSKWPTEKNQRQDPEDFKIAINTGGAILTEVLDKGVLQPSDDEIYKHYGELLLTRNGVSNPVNESQFYSLKEAGNEILTDIPFEKGTAKFDLMQSALVASLHYNVRYDDETTVRYLQSQLNSILPTRGAVQQGELIIFKGNLVDDEKFAKLTSLRRAYEGSLTGFSSYFNLLVGQLSLIAIMFVVLYAFIRQFQASVLEDITRLTLLLFNILLMVSIGRLVVGFFDVNYIYIVPFPVLAIVLRSFFDTRLALFVYLVSMILVGFIIPNSFEFIILQMVAGIASIISVGNLYKRSQLFISSAKIMGVYSLTYISLSLVQEGAWENIAWKNLGYFAANGFLTLMSFPLIFFQEKIFGFVSDISLLELSDTNNPLLRELSQKAPGTFQHSLQVANLAEAATLSVGGNALLVRTGALYHDIGKMNRPQYFIENQSTGLNPHDELSFEESADIIISHVRDGIRLAKKNNLPDLLVDFIRTHHGTSTVMYFYKQYIQNFPDKEVDLAKFTYPGPKPFSRETAILMMADSVEAASRSLEKPDHQKIDKLVEGIIDHQMTTGQFENAEITLKEIKEVKKIFKKLLMNIYHVRIQYPE